MRKLWVFDLDDTLMYTARAYTVARQEATKLIRSVLGPKAPAEPEIMAWEDRIDLGRVKEINPDTGRPYFYCKDRFPRSLRDAYREICEWVHEPVDPDICQELLNIGYQVFDRDRYVRDIKPGVRELLEKLYDHGRFTGLHKIIVLTKGDQQIQQEKIEALEGAGLLWDQNIIVEHDKREALQKLASGTDRECIVVGDNYVSDIRPALELGYRGVWVNVYNWETNHKNAELLQEAKSAGVHIIGELTELLTEPLIEL